MKALIHNGITVIELLMALSTITLLLAVGVPRVEDFAIRARVSEGLTVAAAAKQAVELACAENPVARLYSLDQTVFKFEPSEFVAEIVVAAKCDKQLMWVGVITRNTGSDSDPYLGYMSSPRHSNRPVAWQCRLVRGREEHVPGDCTIAPLPTIN